MKKLLLAATIFMFTATSMATAQGLLDLFMPKAASGSESKYKVKYVEGDKESDYEILLIKIRGAIYEGSEEKSLPFKISKDMLKTIKKDLDTAKNRDAIKAVLLDINSPGGEVTASDIIYHQIENFKKETGKPVVAIFGTLGASGAYYVSCAADYILAHPTSIVGSIGVIMQGINFEKLAKTIGVKAVVLKSKRTPKKDILSPMREMTESEKKMLIGIVDSIYDRFVSIVAKSRKKTVKEITKIADGGIYNADTAKKLGLIDEIGYREDAINAACKLAKIKSAMLVKRSTKKSFSEILSDLAEMQSGMPTFMNNLKKMSEEATSPKMLYKLSLPIK